MSVTSPSDNTDTLTLGRAWALLGLGRLHLSIPPAECDPAAEVSLKRQHILAILQERVEPEQTARSLFEQLPGWDCCGLSW